MKKINLIIANFLMILVLTVAAEAQTNTFTYQGRFTDATLPQPTNGTYAMGFDLYDAATGGNQIIGTSLPAVQVVNGIFTVNLTFPAGVFDGAPRFLEIRVSETVLSPRQQITSSPYSILANNALSLGGVAANQFIREGDVRLTNARPASSVNFGTATLTGTLPINRGGTGSATQNFVDLTTNQSIIGIKSFTNRPSMLTGLNMVDSPIILSPFANDLNHSIRYNSAANGIQFNAFDQFLWVNTRNDVTNMTLETDGDLRILGRYLSASDARYKINVQTFGNALDAILRLRGVTFNWKPEHRNNQNLQIGFIAQEVEAVLPELVSTDENGYKSVSYSNAVPVLVEAIKEQQKQIEEQQKQIKELKQIVCATNPNAALCKELK